MWNFFAIRDFRWREMLWPDIGGVSAHSIQSTSCLETRRLRFLADRMGILFLGGLTGLIGAWAAHRHRGPQSQTYLTEGLGFPDRAATPGTLA